MYIAENLYTNVQRFIGAMLNMCSAHKSVGEMCTKWSQSSKKNK